MILDIGQIITQLGKEKGIDKNIIVDAIKEAGLRNDVKIMIGGAIMDESAAKFIGADAYGADASAAVRLAKSWTE